jgi:hypothetical protein
MHYNITELHNNTFVLAVEELQGLFGKKCSKGLVWRTDHVCAPEPSTLLQAIVTGNRTEGVLFVFVSVLKIAACGRFFSLSLSLSLSVTHMQ